MTIFGHQLRLSVWGSFTNTHNSAWQVGVRQTGDPNLGSVPPKREAVVRGFTAGISPERRAQLMAYGLTPGTRVRVVQHSPVTVLQVEHLELALERDLAIHVQVTPVEG